MKNKKENIGITRGFTLVELLAVIVILAIVLIIAVPGVLSIINKTKNNAYDRQLDMIKEASRLYVTSDSDVTWVGQSPKKTTVSLNTLKTKGYLDQKIMDPKTKKEITCAKTVITKTGSKYDYDVSLCDQVNSSPRLSSNMVPIRYDGSTWVKADYTNKDNNWYNYDNQQWANVAMVTESTRDAYKKVNIGSEIKMEDINTMFTWIPRFKYKLWNVDQTQGPEANPHLAGDYLIDIEFETVSTPKSTGTQNGQWLTHPAFTFGGEELEGFWMAKFETGYLGATTTTDAEQNQVDATKLIVKPSVYSWRNLTLAKMFDNTMQMKSNHFGLTNSEDPHIAKNMEWGAMAYLTNSKYGKTGNPDYDPTEKQVRGNVYKGYMTGCGSPVQDSPGVDTCDAYDTANGQAASTTGNITGIYDAAGGSLEYVMTGMKDQTGTHIIPANSGFTQEQLDQLETEGKYVSSIPFSDTVGNEILNMSYNILGDATSETFPIVQHGTSVWYKDSAYIVYYEEGTMETWYLRGAHLLDQQNTGVMAFYHQPGGNRNADTWRIVMI